MTKKLFLVITLFLSCLVCPAQSLTVSGTVKDIAGEPIIGASVLISGTARGVVSGLDGSFSFPEVLEKASLEISAIGFRTESVQVGGRARIDIVLQEEMAELDDVIVVAYGTAKKESFTGSASVVRGDDIQKRTVGNITKALDGTAPGVQVTSGGGQPGEAATITIRGTGSINASSSPLIVLDGVPYDGSFSSINADDVESMTVLKDASSGALYGARGANGVIVITTKKGQEGKASVSYKGTFGLTSRSIKRYDLLNAGQFVEMTYEALRNSAQYGSKMDYEAASAYAAAHLGETLGGLKNNEYYNPYKNYTWDKLIDQSTGHMKSDARAAWNEDWMDAITNNAAFRTEHVVSLSASGKKSNTLISFGYYKENGTLKTTDFSRYSGRVNSEIQGTSWLKASINANFAHIDSNYQNSTGTSTSNSWYTAQFMGPIYPVYLKDIKGNDVLSANGGRQYEYGQESDNGYANRPVSQGFNSLAELENNRSYSVQNTLSARSSIVFGTIRQEAALYGLRFTINLGTDFSDLGKTLEYDKYHGNAASVGGRIGKTNARTWSYTINELLSYDKKWGDFGLKALAGHEFYRYRYNYAYGEKTGTVDGVDELSPAVTTSENSSYSDNYAIESWLSRVNLSWKDRYYLDGSVRADGSSRFYKDNRWGLFWSVGGSWRISEESWMKATDSWLNNLTCKISYGVQGNDNLGSYYAWQGLYSYTWPNGSEAGSFASKLENKDVTWEKNSNLNTGIDMSLFGGRLSITAEYYRRVTDDMLLNSPLAVSTGFAGYDANVGSMLNQGFEFSLQGVIFNREKFYWDMTFMGAFNRNKVLSLTTGQNVITSGNQVIEVGRPIYTFFIPKSAGVDPSTGSQLYYSYYRRVTTPTGESAYEKCDEYITSDTTLANMSKYYFGSREPVFYGSVGLNIRFLRDFDFSFLGTYSIGGKVFDSVYSSSMKISSAGRNWHSNILRRWQKSGDVTDVPRVEIGGTYATTDNFLMDASYFTIKNITLGYTLPKKVLDAAKINTLRIFLTLDNFWTFNALNGMDPQYDRNGTTDYTYSPTRVASLGIDLKF